MPKFIPYPKQSKMVVISYADQLQPGTFEFAINHLILTADTGYANEANMQYLHDNGINGYIPDYQFRSRNPRFADYKTRHRSIEYVIISGFFYSLAMTICGYIFHAWNKRLVKYFESWFK